MPSRTFADSLDADLAAFFNANEFGGSFSLTRGAATTTGVAAIVAVRSYDAIDGNGIAQVYESIDLDMPKASYAIDGSAVDPRSGDRLTSGGETYEVLPIPGRHCFEVGVDGRTITVHTKRVA